MKKSIVAALAAIILSAASLFGAVGDILSVTVAPDGWHLLVETEGLDVGGTYSTRLGLGVNNDPATGDPDIVLTVTSQGYTGTTPGTRVRTVYGTKEQRLPYPDQATNDEDANGGNAILKIVLSEYVFADDEAGEGKSGTNITYDIDADFYDDGANGNNASTGTATNNSTVPYSAIPPVYNWTWPGRHREDGEFLVNLQAYHHFGQQKRPVATVVFEASDGTNTETDTETAMWLDYPKQGELTPPEFVGHFDAVDFDDDAEITVNATIYPWIGDTPYSTSTGAAMPTPLVGPRVVYSDNDDDLGLWAMVNPATGNDTTAAAVAFTDFDVSEAPYATIDAARADGATNIWLAEGTYAGQGGTTATGTTEDYWVEIRGAFGTNPANVILGTGGSFEGADLGERVKFSHLTITTTTADAFDEIDELWFDNVTFNTANTQLIDNAGSGVWYVTNSTVLDLGQGLAPQNGQNYPCGLIRGNDLSGLDGNCQMYVATGNVKTTKYDGGPLFQDYRAQWTACPQPVPIFSFNKMMAYDGAVQIISMGAHPYGNSSGIAVVGNVFEKAGDANTFICEIGSSEGTDLNTPIDNVMVWNNVFVGSRMGIGYNSEGSLSKSRTYWSMLNNYWDVAGSKTDTFGTPDGARTGNWPLVNSVGCSGNISAGVADIAATGFDFEYQGLLGMDTEQDVDWAAFVDRKSLTVRDPETAGDGNGDYYLQDTSPLIGMNHRQPVSHDLEGSPRATGDACGAYTYYDPSGTTYYVRKDGSDSNDGLTDSSGGAKLTVQAAVNLATSPGDTVSVGEGRYDENVAAAADGAKRAPITIDGLNHKATIKQFDFSAESHVKLTRIRMSGRGDYPDYFVDQDGTDEFTGLVYIPQDSHHAIVDDCIIDGAGAKFVDGIHFVIPDHPPFGVKNAAASFATITNNLVHNITGATFMEIAGDGHDISNNRFAEGYEADFVRLFGRNTVIADNVFEENHDLPENTGNHMDWLQVFGTNNHGSTGHVLERNIVRNTPGAQLTQLTDFYVTRMEIGDWTIRNNVFENIAASSSCTIQRVRWHNNLFYKCNYNGGHPLGTGARAFSGKDSKGHGYEVTGNIFLDCGQPYPDDNDGWYGIPNDEGLVNISADYNYVAKSTGQLGVVWNAVDGISSTPVGDPSNGWSESDWFETNGINGGDPDFVHYGTRDWRLVTGSQLVAAGTALDGLDVDALGDTRPGTPAIGPFEEFAGDVFYVDPGGDNGDPGTSAEPFATIAFAESQMSAGDVLLIQAGTYDEEVALNGIDGTSERERTRFVADGEVTVTAMRAQDAYLEINGLTFTGMQGIGNPTWLAHLRVENVADHLLVKDCHFGPGIYYVVNDTTVSVDGATDTITATGADFTALGFKVGGLLRVGQTTYDPNGNDENSFADGDTEWVIESVGTTTMTVTGDMTGDTGDFWAPLYVGDKSGIGGIEMILSGGDGADHTRITGCTFEDLFGHAIGTNGDHVEIDRCTFTNLNTWSAARLRNDHIRFHHNLLKDCTNNVIYFTVAESAFLDHHGPDPWDFDIALLHTEATAGDSLQIYKNWLQNIEQRWSQIGEQEGDTIVSMWGNVFAGIYGSGSNGRHYSTIQNNTWYRAGMQYPHDSGVGMGGNDPDTADDWTFRRNAFIDNGSRQAPEDEYYSLVFLGGTVKLDYNLATGWETGGFAVPADFVGGETHGIEGGDPLFLDPGDPLGPDGLPFTADDGLRSQMTSPLVLGGADDEPTNEYWVGAIDPYELTEALCGPVSTEPNGTSAPAAVFVVDSISTGFAWNDETEDYNPDWLAMMPWERTTVQRPWDTPESLGAAGVQVTFEGDASIDGLVSGVYSAAGITNYAWTTSDGGSQSGASSSFSHTFNTPGEVTVTLTITNSDAEEDSTTRTYLVTGVGAPDGSTLSTGTFQVGP